MLFILLWPLAVYHRLGQRMYMKLEPALQRLDFSVRGYMISKQREKQCKFLYCVSDPWCLKQPVNRVPGLAVG